MEEIIVNNFYNKRTIYTNCTIEVWENTDNGNISVAWTRTKDTKEYNSEEDFLIYESE